MLKRFLSMMERKEVQRKLNSIGGNQNLWTKMFERAFWHWIGQMENSKTSENFLAIGGTDQYLILLLRNFP